MALFIVVLLNINSYAAVGANDGSAFVTKAEFDALVNTFNEQMDGYQAGLNSKIDGAIANYLSGLSSVTTSNQTAIFIKNAGEDAKITFRTTADFPYAYSVPGVNLKFTYANAFALKDSAGEWHAYGKSCYWNNSRNAVKQGKRLVGVMDGNSFFYKGYTTDYSEEFDINWSFCSNGSDDGYVDADYYQYPVCFVGTQNAIFNNDEASWVGLKTFLMHRKDSSMINAPTAVTANVTVNDHNYTMEYDAIFSEKSDSEKLYRFVDKDVSKLVAGEGWSMKSGEFHDALNNAYRTSYITIDGVVRNRTLYKEPSANYTAYATNCEKYVPTIAPKELGNGAKWSSIMYNDLNTYEYYEGNKGKEKLVIIKGFPMTAGVPLCIVQPGDKISWSYKFTTELSGRIIYLKYGWFSGKTVEGDGIFPFDASKKEGKIEFKSEKYAMMFLKWPVGQTIDCSGCSIVNIQNDGDS